MRTLRRIVAVAAVLALTGCGSAASTARSRAVTASAVAAPASSPKSLCDQLIAWRDAHGGAQASAVDRALSTWSTDASSARYGTVIGRDSSALARVGAAALSNPPPGPAGGPWVAAMTYLNSAATDAESARGETLVEQAGSIASAGKRYGMLFRS
jgi:hypothetical protein